MLIELSLFCEIRLNSIHIRLLSFWRNFDRVDRRKSQVLVCVDRRQLRGAENVLRLHVNKQNKKVEEKTYKYLKFTLKQNIKILVMYVVNEHIQIKVSTVCLLLHRLHHTLH
jgi:hypothetical protein